MDQAPLLGRCKDCDYALFTSRDNVTNVDDFKLVRTAGRAYRVSTSNGLEGFFARCDKGHRFFVLKTVKGTYSPDHKCDSRCLNARGNDCTCSCGGANHGRGHAVTTHVASTRTMESAIGDYGDLNREAVDATTPKFIGEVGKHIRGNVRVVRSSPLQNETVLYTFETDKGDFLKWFAPIYADPKWENNTQHAIRAKVKRHDDSYGLIATIVTYVEEV